MQPGSAFRCKNHLTRVLLKLMLELMVLHRENCSQFFPKRKKMKPKSLMLRLCVYLFLYSSAFLAQFYVAAVVQDFCSSTFCAFKILYASCIILFLFFALYVIMQEFYY